MSVSFERPSFFIDKSYRILNYNVRAKQEFPKIENGEFCYKAIRGYNSPCPDCPIFNENTSLNIFYENESKTKKYFPFFANGSLPDGTEGYSIISDEGDPHGEEKDAELSFMRRKMEVYRKVNYDCAYLYFEANLSKDLITSGIYEVVDTKEYELDMSKKGFTYPISYTEYHASRLDGKVLSNRDEYREIADCKKLIDRFNNGEDIQELIFRSRSSNGYLTWHYASVYMFKTDDSDDVYAIYVVRDIDHKLSKEQTAKRNQEVMQILADEYSVVMYVELETGIVSICNLPNHYTDDAMKKVIANEKYKTVWKYYVNRRVINSDAEHLLRLTDSDYLNKLLENKKSYSYIYRVGTEDNFTYSELKIVKVGDGDLNALVLGIADKDEAIRARQEQQRRLESALILAQKDSLTGVRNRTGYDIAASKLDEQLLAGAKKEFAIVMFDINGLKKTNDVHGHDKGNLLIINSSELICNIYNHSMVFRIGGDEFVAVLEGDDYANRDKLLRKLRRKVALNAVKGEPLYINVSIASGMSVYDPAKDTCVDDVFQRADKLMYENKSRIKKRFFNK